MNFTRRTLRKIAKSQKFAEGNRRLSDLGLARCLQIKAGEICNCQFDSEQNEHFKSSSVKTRKGIKMSRCDVRNGAYEELSTDVERIFDSLLGRTVGTMLRTGNAEKYAPMLDITEGTEAYEVYIDLPGVRPEDVKLEMYEGKLVVSGQRSTGTGQKDKALHRMERVSGNFTRAISLPSEVDVERIDASYEHGVLKILIPKAVKQQPKKIEIRTSTNGA